MVRYLLLTIASLLVISGCGSQDNQSTTIRLNGSDREFIRQMIPHHQAAVEMARIGLVRGDHRQIKQLSRAIITAQQQEILTLKSYRVKPVTMTMDDGSMMAHGTDREMLDRLMASNNFDLDFIKEMSAHHQAAIEMSRIEAKDGSNQQLKALAKKIAADQGAQIKQMAAWQQQWQQAQTGPAIDSKARGRPSQTKKTAKAKPLRAYILGSLIVDHRHPRAAMSTDVVARGAARYGVEIINRDRQTRDIIVEIDAGDRKRLIEEKIAAGRSRLMSTSLPLRRGRQPLTIKAQIKS